MARMFMGFSLSFSRGTTPMGQRAQPPSPPNGFRYAAMSSASFFWKRQRNNTGRYIKLQLRESPLTCRSCLDLVHRAPLECPARSTFADATPLLEKERHALLTTGISQLFNPPCFHGPGAPGPEPPPTIAQCTPERSTAIIGPMRGSNETKRICAGSLAAVLSAGIILTFD